MDPKTLLTIVISLLGGMAASAILLAKNKGYLDELRSLVERLCIPLSDDRAAHWEDKAKQCSSITHLVPQNTKVVTGLGFLPAPSDHTKRLTDELEKLAVSLFPMRIALIGAMCLAVGFVISSLLALVFVDFVEPTLRLLGDKVFFAILLGCALSITATLLTGAYVLFMLLPQVNGAHVRRLSHSTAVWEPAVDGITPSVRPLKDAKLDASYAALAKTSS